MGGSSRLRSSNAQVEIMGDDQPDWAALYSAHREAMHRVAARVLREAGLADQANDAVHGAMVSLMSSPPKDVRNWEAVMVTAAKRRALDQVKSAAVRHAGPELRQEHDRAEEIDIAEGVAELVDRQREAGAAWDSLSALDQRHRKAVWDCVALERPRAEVAAELGVTPGRVSQMVKRGLVLMREAMSREEGVG